MESVLNVFSFKSIIFLFDGDSVVVLIMFLLKFDLAKIYIIFHIYNLNYRLTIIILPNEVIVMKDNF